MNDNEQDADKELYEALRGEGIEAGNAIGVVQLMGFMINGAPMDALVMERWKEAKLLTKEGKPIFALSKEFKDFPKSEGTTISLIMLSEVFGGDIKISVKGGALAYSITEQGAKRVEGMGAKKQ